VLLESQDHSVVLIVEDDGIGFDLDETERMSEKGLGLLGIKERALLVGGSAEIESSIEHGTTIYVRIPLQFNDETKQSEDGI
jgi:signal transduction histidine kinase